MSPEKQRIAIAEICGTKIVEAEDGFWDFEKNGKLEPQGLWKIDLVARLPNYPASLDAMHEALLWLPIEQEDNFEVELAVVVFGDFMRHGVRLQDFKTTNATAAQRAEAFLKTHNRWEDGE